MAPSVDVYILTDGNHKREVDIIAALFDSPFYNVNRTIVPKPIGTAPSEKLTSHQIYKAYQIQWCLQNTKEHNPERSVICIKDSSVTNISKDHLDRLIRILRLKDDVIDIFYLCRWQDACQKITDETNIPDLNNKIGRTFSPYGLQTLYFSPNGREILLGYTPMANKEYFVINKPLDQKLNEEIYNGNIIAYCCLNNIFSYDISRANHNSDYNRTHVCRSIIPDDNGGGENNNGNGFLWFILVVIVVILIAYAIIRIGSRR